MRRNAPLDNIVIIRRNNCGLSHTEVPWTRGVLKRLFIAREIKTLLEMHSDIVAGGVTKYVYLRTLIAAIDPRAALLSIN